MGIFQYPIVIILLKIIIWAPLVGYRAKRKNRNFWLWGLLGAAFSFWPLLILAFLSFKCKKCGGKISNKEHKEGVCPHCDHLQSVEN